MGKAAYPTVADLTDLLTDAGLTSAGLDLTSAVEAGRAEFERRTDRVMLAVAGARVYDAPVAPTGVLVLTEDLLSLTSLTYDGEAWTAANEFILLPRNRTPSTAIEFRRRWAHPVSWAQRGKVTITGSWGFGTTIPEDAWRAMLLLAALEVIQEIGTALTGGLTGWKEADVSEQYGASPYGGLREQWIERTDAVVQRYRRVSVGV